MIIIECKNCGNNFESEKWRHYKFCCNKCSHEYKKKTYKKKRIKIICKQCGRKFEEYKSSKKKFCDRKCSAEYQTGK